MPLGADPSWSQEKAGRCVCTAVAPEQNVGPLRILRGHDATIRLAHVGRPTPEEGGLTIALHVRARVLLSKINALSRDSEYKS